MQLLDLRCIVRNRYLFFGYLAQAISLCMLTYSVIAHFLGNNKIPIEISLNFVLWIFIVNFFISIRTDFGRHTKEAYIRVGESILRNGRGPDPRYAKSYNHYCGRAGAKMALKDAKRGMLAKYVSVRNAKQLILDAFWTDDTDDALDFIVNAFWLKTKTCQELEAEIQKTLKLLDPTSNPIEYRFCEELLKSVRMENNANPESGIEYIWFIKEILKITGWEKPENLEEYAKWYEKNSDVLAYQTQE